MYRRERVTSGWMGPRHGARFARVLGVLTLAVVGLGGLATAERANAQPELEVGFAQICVLCDDQFTVDVLGSQPFVLVDFFRTGQDLGLNPPNIFLRQRGVVRQRGLNEIVPGPAVEVQGRALSIPGEIGLSAESSFTGQTFDEFFDTGGLPISDARASFRVEDAIVSGPGPAGTLVPVTLNLLIRGLMAVEVLPRDRAGFGSIGGFARLELRVAVRGQAQRGVLTLDLSQISNGPSFPFVGRPISGTEFFQGLEAQAQIEDSIDPLTGLRLVPFVRLPIALDLALTFSVLTSSPTPTSPSDTFPFAIEVLGIAQSSTSFRLGFRNPSGYNHRAEALIDFITVSFPTGSPVLDLPPGFDFNSADGQVINNRWLRGSVPPPRNLGVMREAVCDVDGNGQVNRNDIDAIVAARNTAASPGDPRDVNGPGGGGFPDGMITMDDARYCALRCDKQRCAP
jgi:hypothetical protein